MNKPILPNFLIVGAPKCGTTSLWNYLRQHPEIFMTRNKEPRYLIRQVFNNINPKSPNRLWTLGFVDSFEGYAGLFNDVKNEKAVGEATPTYLFYHEIAIPNIKEVLGEVKIIIILRNPVDRAFSAYKHLVRENFEPLSFEQCLALEDSRYKEHWSPMHFFTRHGMYYNQVKAFKDNFSEVFIALTEDLKNNQDLLLRDLYEFLGIDDSFEPDISEKHNVSEIEINTGFKNFLNDPNHSIKKALRPFFLKTIGIKNTERIVNYFKNKNTLRIKNNTRRRLVELYRDDILKLGALIDRDLSHWLN